LRRMTAMKSRIMVLVALVGMVGLGTIAKADEAATTTIRPGTTDVITATIRVGHLAEVGVVGDGDTDLDHYVNDPYVRLVGYDDDNTDRCQVGGQTPSYRGFRTDGAGTPESTILAHAGSYLAHTELDLKACSEYIGGMDTLPSSLIPGLPDAHTGD